MRWFQYGTFLPTMRTHGTRKANEVWSYGPQAQPILEKYLKLRYELMPYLYSLGWLTHQTAPPSCALCSWIFPPTPKSQTSGTSTCSAGVISRASH